jgi:hypothetical protein
MSALASRNDEFCVKAMLLSGCGRHDAPDGTYGCIDSSMSKRGDWNGTETYDKRRFGRAEKCIIDLMDDGSIAGM